MDAVKIKIGHFTFDHADYDADSDVLYLRVGEPRAAEGEETPEGHLLRFAPGSQDVVGLTLVGARAAQTRRPAHRHRSRDVRSEQRSSRERARTPLSSSQHLPVPPSAAAVEHRHSQLAPWQTNRPGRPSRPHRCPSWDVV